MHAVRFFQEGLDILPTDLLNGSIGTGCPVAGWVAAHHVLSLLLGDVELAHPEILADGDLMHGALHLIAGSASWAGLPGIVSMDDLIGTHAEGTGWDLDDDDTRFAQINEVGLRRRAGQ